MANAPGQTIKATLSNIDKHKSHEIKENVCLPLLYTIPFTQSKKKYVYVVFKLLQCLTYFAPTLPVGSSFCLTALPQKLHRFTHALHALGRKWFVSEIDTVIALSTLRTCLRVLLSCGCMRLCTASCETNFYLGSFFVLLTI